jgi:hypothetical protein
MQKRKTLTLLSAVAVAAVTLWLRRQGAPLTIKGITPLGILNLEFAWNEDAVMQVKNAWHGGVLKVAQQNIYIDFLYIIAYTAFFHLLCTGMAARLTGRLANWGRQLGKAVVMAGVFDIAENSLMLLSISQTPNNYTAVITCLFAGLKFAIIAMAIVYLLVGGIALAAGARRASA